MAARTTGDAGAEPAAAAGSAASEPDQKGALAAKKSAAAETPPLDPHKMPRHVAIIMDGNGRWAQHQGKMRLQGHLAGARTVEAVVAACARLQIPFLTLYAFSSENWKRPTLEVRGLMALLRRFLIAKRGQLKERGISLRAIGNLQGLPASVRQELERSIAMLAGGEHLQLCLALNYGSRDEMVRAARRMVAEASRGALAQEQVDEASFSSYLDTAGMPDPDLVIRTAGEQRLSNFLLWQLAYAEIWFSPVCWPDFTEQHLVQAIAEYQRRRRTFGGL